MAKRSIGSVIGVFCLCLLAIYPTRATQDRSPAKNAGTPRITVLSPKGTPPRIKLIPMAPQPASLEGKTVYLVDDGFQGSEALLKEMIGWFGRNMPDVKTEFRKKGGGGFDAEDPKLWAEIKESVDAMVMATGH